MSVHLPPLICATRANTTTVYKPQERNKSGFCFSTPFLRHTHLFTASTQDEAGQRKENEADSEKTVSSLTLCKDEEEYNAIKNKSEEQNSHENNITTGDGIQVDYVQHKLWLHETPLLACNNYDKKNHRNTSYRSMMMMKMMMKITPNESDASCKLFRPSLHNQMAGLSIRRKVLKRNYSQLHFGAEMIASRTEPVNVRNANSIANDRSNDDNTISINRISKNTQNIGEDKVIDVDHAADEGFIVEVEDKSNEEVDYDINDSKEAVRLLFAMRARDDSAVQENEKSNNELNKQVACTETNERKEDEDQESETALSKITNADKMHHTNYKEMEPVDPNNESYQEMRLSLINTSNVTWLPSAYDTLALGLARDDMNCYCKPRFANTISNSINHNYSNNTNVDGNCSLYIHENPLQELSTFFSEGESSRDTLLERKLGWLQYAEQDERLLITLLEFQQSVIPLYTASLPCCLAHDQSCTKFMQCMLHLRSTEQITTKLHSVENVAFNDITHTSLIALQNACEHVEEEYSQYITRVLLRKARHEKELIWHKHGMEFHDTLTKMKVLHRQEKEERSALICQWKGCKCNEQMMLMQEQKEEGEELYCLHGDNDLTFYHTVVLNNYNSLYNEELAEHDTFIVRAILETNLLCEQDKERIELVKNEENLRKRLYDYHEYCLNLWHANMTRVDVNTAEHNQENLKIAHDINSSEENDKRANKYVKYSKDSPICSYLSYRLMRLHEQTALQLTEEHIMRWELEEWQSIMHNEQHERECVLLSDKCFTEELQELCVEEQNEWHSLMTSEKAGLADIIQCERDKQRKRVLSLMQERSKQEIEMFVTDAYKSLQQLSEELLHEHVQCQRAFRLEIIHQTIREKEMQLTESGIVQQWLLERRANEIVNDEKRLRYYIYCEQHKVITELYELHLWQSDEWYRKYYLQLVKDEQNEFAQLVFISEEVKCRQAIAEVLHREYNAFYTPQLVTCKSTNSNVIDAPILNLRHYILADLNDFTSIDNLHILFSMENTSESDEEMG